MTVLVRGFTLIELVITVAIVAVLASVALPVAELTVQRAKEQELRAVLRDLRTAIDAYRLAVAEGRIAKSAEESGYPPSLAALVEGVADARDPNGARIVFLRRIPRDPLNRDPSLPAAETWGLRSYASDAAHPQAGEDVFDVYSLSERSGLNGIAYREW
jgi:general secretion pathway protein G